MHLRYLDCWNWNLETGFHAFVIFRFSQFYSYWSTQPITTFAFAETKRWQPLTTYHHHKLLSIQIIIRFEENVKKKHSSHRLSQNAIEAIIEIWRKDKSVMLNLTLGSGSLPTAERMISFYQNDYPISLFLEKSILAFMPARGNSCSLMPGTDWLDGLDSRFTSLHRSMAINKTSAFISLAFGPSSPLSGPICSDQWDKLFSSLR